MKAGPRKGQTPESPRVSPRSERRAASATAASPGSTSSTSAPAEAAPPVPASSSSAVVSRPGSKPGRGFKGSTKSEFSQAKLPGCLLRPVRSGKNSALGCLWHDRSCYISEAVKVRDAQIVDGRRARGDRTRRAILDEAVQIASAEGLEGLSIGRLAEALGVSKSGLFAHFGSKLDLQVETVKAAREVFMEEVVRAAR